MAPPLLRAKPKVLTMAQDTLDLASLFPSCRHPTPHFGLLSRLRLSILGMALTTQLLLSLWKVILINPDGVILSDQLPEGRILMKN